MVLMIPFPYLILNRQERIVVTALHPIPGGEIWTEKEIKERIKIIAKSNEKHPFKLYWNVVESLPGYHFGNALKLALYILSPEAIILGGSVSKSYGYFEEALVESINSFL